MRVCVPFAEGSKVFLYSVCSFL